MFPGANGHRGYSLPRLRDLRQSFPALGQCIGPFPEIFPLLSSYFSTNCAPSGLDPANRGQHWQKLFSWPCAHAAHKVTGFVAGIGAGRPGFEERPFWRLLFLLPFISFPPCHWFPPISEIFLCHYGGYVESPIVFTCAKHNRQISWKILQLVDQFACCHSSSRHESFKPPAI